MQAELSVLREQACRCVVGEHRDPQGELIAELLEVTYVPQMLASASDEVTAAARTLRERIGSCRSPGLGRHQ